MTTKRVVPPSPLRSLFLFLPTFANTAKLLLSSSSSSSFASTSPGLTFHPSPSPPFPSLQGETLSPKAAAEIEKKDWEVRSVCRFLYQASCLRPILSVCVPPVFSQDFSECCFFLFRFFAPPSLLLLVSSPSPQRKKSLNVISLSRLGVEGRIAETMRDGLLYTRKSGNFDL